MAKRTRQKKWSGEWEQQSIQLPDHLLAQFRVFAKSNPGGIKYTGTAAVAMLIGLPDFAKHYTVRSVVENTWIGPGQLMPAFVTAHMLFSMVQAVRDAEHEGAKFETPEDYLLWLVGINEQDEEAMSPSREGSSADSDEREIIEIDPNNMPHPDDMPPGTKWYIDRICSPEFLASKANPKAKQIDTSQIPPPRGKKAPKDKTG